MKSIVYQSDKMPNLDRKFGADPFYYNATFVFRDGRRVVARFTEEQVQAAIDRGAHDPDGAKPRGRWDWLTRLFR